MGNSQRLRIIVDDTLTRGQQLAQACHLMREWSERHPELDAEWYRKSNILVCLSAPPEKIFSIAEQCEKKDIGWACFVEPDLNNKVTGIVLAPCKEAKRLTSSLPLALR